ncbi:MAG: GntR family transcriptional regulator [Planctomycetes bacterium]|nr:GntR family transcriptional regulator [Planctomycetota bacterium]
MPESYSHGLGSRSERVLNHLREAILEGRYRPGDRLPTERALCKTLEVSRNTLRRAIERLSIDGTLEVRQGAGTFVREQKGSASDTVAVMFMFGMEALSRLQRRLMDRGMLLCLYCQAHHAWDPESERVFLQKILDLGCRALLANCSPVEPLNNDLLAALATRGIRVIHTGWHQSSLPAEEYLLADYRRAGELAAEALHAGAYKHLVTVGSPTRYPIATLLEEGFSAAFQALRPGEDPLPRLRFTPGWEKEVKALCRRAKGSIGFFCETRQYAEALVKILPGLGRALPEGAGLIGVPMDNEEGAQPDESIDLIDFDVEALLTRAAPLVCRVDPEPVRELLLPRWIKRGTIRTDLQSRA